MPDPAVPVLASATADEAIGPPPAHVARHRSWTAIRLLAGALLASLIGPAALLVYVAVTTYHSTVAEGKVRLARVAQIAQEQSARVVETNEVISRAVFSAVDERPVSALRADADTLHATLHGLAANLRQLQSIWIWDQEGHPVASSLRPDPPPQLSVRDREYFQWAAGHPGPEWFVSQPLRSKLTGEPFFDFTKRLPRADGSFAGVLSISLFPGYFSELFTGLAQQDPALAVTLVRSDGIVIARYPQVGLDVRLGETSPLLAAMRAGRTGGDHDGVSTVDDVQRYVSFRRIGELPLYVAATADRRKLLAPWRRATLLLAAFTIPLSFLLASLCWYAIRRVRAEHALALVHQQEYENRLKAEKALRQSQKLEALGRLTAGVAHDFNNLLMVVQNSAVLAQKLEEKGQPAGPALAPIQRAVATGAQLTRQLLAFARRQPMQVGEVHLDQVVPATADLLRSSLGRAYRIEVSLEPGLPPVVADEAELELALINLCINARDAMPDGGLIRIRAEAAGGQDVLVSVRDEGQGIAPELVDKVFEPFFTTKPLGKGTGLGLAQVQSCVEQAGGRLRLESDVGVGTTVAMTLRAGERREAQPSVPPPAPPEMGGDLLLVEDNDAIADSLTVLLTDSGMRVRRHDRAEAAAEFLRQGGRCDILLSDISLAGQMTGVDLAMLVARERPGLPIVLMTGYTDRLAQATQQGFQVLSKPVSPDALTGALARALAKAGSGEPTAA